MGGTLIEGVGLASTAASLLGPDRAERKYYNALAKTAEQQAQQTEENARRNAAYMFEQAASQSSQLAAQYAALQGQQKTAMAASGLGHGSATAQLILKNSRLNALLDEEMLNKNMQRAIYENDTQAQLQSQQYRVQADQYRAVNKLRSPFWSKAGNTLGMLWEKYFG